MTFTQLAVVGAVALLGPLLAFPRRWHLPVLLGELVAGLLLGRTGSGYLDSSDPTFTFLADIGFALVMFVAGTHVPVRAPGLRPALWAGFGRALAVGAASVVVGFGIAWVAGTGHGPLYAVLLASSSAALVLPVVDSLGLGGPKVIGLLPQVAIADTVCIVALPLAIDPAHAWRAAGGAALVIVAAAVIFVVFRAGERRGWRQKVHDVSEDRLFAVELRVQLAVLFGLAALAVRSHVSIMLAGFTLGLAVEAVAEPRRLAKQLFALTEGFLAPVFFVWLGAELDLRELGQHPQMILLGLALGVGAAVTHLVPLAVRQPLPLGMLASAQLGVPVAAATIGSQIGVLEDGEAAALMLGAVMTIGLAVLGGSLAVRAGLVEEDRRGSGRFVVAPGD